MDLLQYFQGSSCPSSEYQEHAASWILRMLELGDIRTHYLRKAQTYPELTMFLGESPADPPKNEKQLDAAIGRTRELYPTQPGKLDAPLGENLDVLGSLLSLSETDKELVAFRAIARLNSILFEFLYLQREWTDSRLARTVGHALGLPREVVAAALSPGGRLFEAGLAKRSNLVVDSFQDKFEVPHGLINALFECHRDLDSLLRFAAIRASPPMLSREDFGYVEAHVEFLVAYLRGAAAGMEQGANVLIHGKPGVGKTELAALVAKTAGLHLYLVNMRGDAAEALEPEERFRAYQLNQALFSSSRNHVVLFDEVEDVIPVPNVLGDTKIAGRKAWLNRLLEDNPVPAIWVANRVTHFDPAYLRRFDCVIELRPPPRSWRRKLLEQKLAPYQPAPDDVSRWSDDSRLTPALMTRAVRALDVAAINDSAQASAMFDQLFAGQLGARRQRAKARGHELPGTYCLEYINASVDVAKLATQLEMRPRGRMLFHGPPGTGKTAFAQYLADVLGKPFLTKRASDLLSPFIGETEWNLCKMFQEAEDEDALLLLDEADGFLQDRTTARHSWEITQVNELLVQMEAYRGLFVCATNFFDALDSAALRRFGLVVAFNCLTEDQRCRLFWSTLGFGEPANGAEGWPVRTRLRQLSNLTAGDYRAATQRTQLLGEPLDVEVLLRALQEMSRLKNGHGRRAIGFAA